jgi:hypothetical protein
MPTIRKKNFWIKAKRLLNKDNEDIVNQHVEEAHQWRHTKLTYVIIVVTDYDVYLQ